MTADRPCWCFLLPFTAFASLIALASCSAVPGEPGNTDCGNGVREPGEQCEGADLGGQTCEGLGLGSGALSCTSCLFDTSGCSNCGNGVCDPAESRTSCPADCGVRKIAAGEYHACAAMGDGTLWCWGGNSKGTLGNGTFDPSPVPVPVPGIDGVVDLCAAMIHTCALLTDGTLWCWGGYNGMGLLGDGTENQSPVPVQVTGVSDGTSVSCGSEHTCVLTTGGTVRCWGNNYYGQLGDGNMGQNSLIPVPVTSLADVADLAVGGGQSCASRTDGTAWCWGEGGTLGNVESQAQPSDVPLQVDVLDDVRAMARCAGSSSSICAIRSDTSLWCWGRNLEGNVGDGTYDNLVIAPVQTLGLTDIVSAATGHEHTCASTTSGVAFCWGCMGSPNQFGQLGSGSTEGSATAVQVVDLDSVVSVSAGGFFSCAVREDGSAWCWGNNYSGELGVGDEPQQSSLPLQVAFP